LSILFFLSTSGWLPAQTIDINKKIKTKTVKRADRHADQGIDKGLDAMENGIKKAATDEKNDQTTTTEKTSKAKSKSPSNTSNNEGSSASTSESETPSLTSYSNFDFIPGEKVIFYEDFSQDAIGDFPALWYTNGSGEVVTLNNYPGKWLMMSQKSDYCYPFTQDMPENYTIEFDYIRQSCQNNSNFTQFFLINVPKGKGAFDRIDYPGFRMELMHENIISLNNFGIEAMEKCNNRKAIPLLKQNCGKTVKVSIWVQKQRVRIYFNEEKVFDVPKLLPKDKKMNVFRFYKRIPDKKDFITNIRIAIGAPDLRNKLLTEGKLVTYGILFDTGSDKIKPESYGVLKEISAVLSENPGLKIKIVGHTDADGDAAKNLDLSKRRAVSVKNELSKTFQINASRIETDGKGKTEPVAPNDMPANKAQNRRVEFIKI
jgi:outer membrane protein OmpA-like peptidoglycan-associated protein